MLVRVATGVATCACPGCDWGCDLCLSGLRLELRLVLVRVATGVATCACPGCDWSCDLSESGAWALRLGLLLGLLLGVVSGPKRLTSHLFGIPGGLLDSRFDTQAVQNRQKSKPSSSFYCPWAFHALAWTRKMSTAAVPAGCRVANSTRFFGTPQGPQRHAATPPPTQRMVRCARCHARFCSGFQMTCARSSTRWPGLSGH